MTDCKIHPDDIGIWNRYSGGSCMSCLLSPGGNLNLTGHPCEELASIVQTIAWAKNWEFSTIRLRTPLWWAETLYRSDPRARMEHREGKATLVIPMQIGDLAAVVERRDDVLVERNGDRLFVARFQ